MHLRHRLTPAVFLAGLLCCAAHVRAEEPLPKAEEILDKFVEATGGKAAYQKVHNEKATGTFEFVGKGVKGTMVHYRAEPNKMYMRVELENIGAMENGTDGETAWTLSALQGPHIAQGEERAFALREAMLRAPLEWRKVYKNAETAGVVDVNGQACYKVVLTPNEGKPETQYYDKKSNLLVKMSMTVVSQMGEIPTDTTVSDYKEQSGLLSPRKSHHTVLGQEFEITISQIEYNIDMPKDRFDLPAEIKALATK
ncbi:MAG: outer membrane lipoprotein-sorting protein [Acidobacteriia bacterium]|nr:outer membrane lipoprotein-sorting protein [Terriglobia bacterium]